MTDGPARILIVEDEAIIAADIERCLAAHQYLVVGAVDTATAAVERAGAGVDLVLMDIVLKGPLDGIWAAGQVGLAHDVPVVFLTAFGDAQTLRRARRVGPYAYVLKPFDDGELIRTIDVALSLHRVQRDVRGREIQDALDRLAAGLSHEARNPLFGLTSAVDALDASGAATREVFAQHLDTMRAQARRLNELVTRMSELAAPPGPATPVRLDDVARAAIAAAREAGLGAGLAIDMDVAGPLTILGNERRLELALRSVLLNAIEHCPAGGAVRLAVREREADGVKSGECEVTDEGTGFSPAQFARGPEPFSSDGWGRLGLGLAIARHVAREHGGSLLLANRPEGGARVVMRLPAA